jgi:GntR family transcriptional regulator
MTDPRRIDRDSDRTAYKQLADIYRDLIMSGDLPAASELPSESVLADTYGVGRNTVQSALRELRGEGLIVSERGRNWRVRAVRVVGVDRYTAAQANYNPDQASKFAAEHGVPWAAFDLARVYRTIPAPARVAKALEIEPGAQVCERRWTHATGGVPLRLSWSYLDMDRFGGTVLTDPDEPPWPGGTIAQLKHLGQHVVDIPTEVQMRQGTDEELAFFELPPGSSVMEVFRVQVVYAGMPGAVRPVEAAVQVYTRGTVLRYNVPVGRRWVPGIEYQG